MTTTEKHLTFWDHETALLHVLMEIADTEAMGQEPDPSLQLVLRDYVISAGEKRDRMAGFLRSCEARAEEFHREEHRLKARREALENAAKRIRDYVVAVMEQTGTLKIEGVTSTLLLVRNPSSMIVTGPIPPQFERVIPERREPDKGKLKDEWEAGRPVENTRLVEGAHRLVIR